MKKLHFFLLGFLVLPFYSFGQDWNFVQFDSATYAHYLAGNWNELLVTGEKGEDQGFDFFYLNLRMGAAAFYLKNYPLAEKYLLRAQQQNSNDPVLKDFLYWTMVYQEKYLRSGEFIIENRTSEEKKFSPTSVFLEGGLKLSNKTDTMGHLIYLGAGADLANGNSSAWFLGFNHVSQAGNIWGNFFQESAYFGFTGNAGRGFFASSAIQYSYYAAVYDYLAGSMTNEHKEPVSKGGLAYDISNIQNTSMQGNFRQNGFLLNGRGGWDHRRMNFSLFGNMFFLFQTPDFIVDYKELTVTRAMGPQGLVSVTKDSVESKVPFKSSQTSFAYNAGASIQYRLPFLENRLKVSASIILPIENGSTGKLIVSPNFKFRIRQSDEFAVSWLYKGPDLVAGETGVYLLNTRDEITSMFSASYKVKIFKKLSLSGIYQLQSQTDFISSTGYYFNSIILNLNYLP